WDAETRSWPGDQPAHQSTQQPENYRLPTVNEVIHEDAKKSSVGTAFAVGDGVWLTARHVVEGCDTLSLQTAPKRGVRVQAVAHHPNADVAVLRTKGGRPGFALARSDATKSAFMVGFPAGRPGAVSASLIGPSRLKGRGRYRTEEPVLVWSEKSRIPDRFGSLGGLSGGPVFNATGQVIGVVLAENRRRGRIMTAVPETIAEAARLAAAPLAASGEAPAFSSDGYPAVARTLITSLRVSRAFCQVRS
ncbi:MAG: serine protease, partial [Proteobacteria bacterium]|nr:serine protease [Pseudomonadota bacterium]